MAAATKNPHDVSNHVDKPLLTIFALMFSFLRKRPTEPIPTDIWSFKIPAIDGGVIDMSAYRGKPLLIVNTASFCGFTPQYEQLEALYRMYKGELIVIGFPSNDFMFQEPLSNKKIAEFCSTKYDVTFPMAAKVGVKGNSKAPIYQWLTEERYNGLMDSTVKWNFQKYLVNREGKLIHMFPHEMPPDDPSIIEAIETAIKR